ncbi:hypothetical protein KIW84_061018 [Lathyrus oleraceus]|uniref:Uncharacterized protein n=1 Tax=Pisum sativum TaxID=3888 RepID=A0A9D4W2Z9_PEA|nr:hypothetical protein KIW84_061018 [Pisum sativum]
MIVTIVPQINSIEDDNNNSSTKEDNEDIRLREFANFTKSEYQGLETIWDVEVEGVNGIQTEVEIEVEGSENSTLGVNFEDSKNDIEIDGEMIVDDEEVSNKINDKAKGKAKGRENAEGSSEGSGLLCKYKRHACEYDYEPPPIKRQPGRPKKKRNIEVGEMVRDETHLKQAKYGIKCNRWHEDGHNKATCKLPQPQAPPSQVLEGTSTQESQTIISSQPPQPSISSQPPQPFVSSQPP